MKINQMFSNAKASVAGIKLKRARKTSVKWRIKCAESVLRYYTTATGRKQIPDEKEFLAAREMCLRGSGVENTVFLFNTIVWVMRQIIALMVIINGAKAFYENMIEKDLFSFIVVYFGMDIIEKIITKLRDSLNKKNEIIAKMSYEDYKKWLEWGTSQKR